MPGSDNSLLDKEIYLHPVLRFILVIVVLEEEVDLKANEADVYQLGIIQPEEGTVVFTHTGFFLEGRKGEHES